MVAISALYNDLPLTSFPNEIDSFLTYVNVTASDGPLIKQYIEAMNSGNQTQANQIFANIPSATQKVIKATDLNKLSQAILSVERFYKTDVEPFVNQKQVEWTAYIDQFKYIGQWASGTTYQVNNMVTYTVNGLSLLFIATQAPPQGTAPANKTYWRQLTLQGQQGESGVGLSYRQAWNAGAQYYTNDAVTHEGSLWQSLQNNQNIQPGTSDYYWKLIVKFTTTVYPIQDTAPAVQSLGELWFNTSVDPINYYHLEPLSNPATATQISSGFEAYDAQGNRIIGTMA